ncbi:N-myristoyl transferase [Rhizodiscina lignyota]|uniref:Glycylpeptide N-tetradecanoyltransferase n=1 Tax=Rhizodiscina lignyota TaxID=1504668 RepID=A0A9P4MEA6_9PEZI|nr:N-myristoyl transferase [Rhizodiscina lignyota]
MPEESKIAEPETGSKPSNEAPEAQPDVEAEADSSADEAEPASTNGGDAAEGEAAPAKKKKKSKRKKIKDALTGGSSSSAPSEKKLTEEQLNLLLEANPSLKAEVANMPPSQLSEMMSKLSMADLLTGLSVGGKNQKDMASYKFWQTQPVVKFDEKGNKELEDGPIKEIDISRVRKEPGELVEGFEWVLMDLTDQHELEEVFDLLSNHYVEDHEAMFRFQYSASFLHWALMAPGWRKEWHIGVRATQSRKLVAFISGIPVDLRVRKNVLHCSEINFLCIHKKLRSKRLAPVLIKEVTRRCYLNGIFQAIYTAGVVLPTPVATCRYFHRSLDWEKLYDVGFSPLPPGSTKLRQVSKFKLPTETATPGLRPMQRKDVNAVLNLLKRYLDRMDMAQIFTKAEVEHWLLHDEKLQDDDRVVWTYVAEDPKTKKITDFFSFYRLASSVIGDTKGRIVNAAYLYYYATEAAWDPDKNALKTRLNLLIKDALIVAKQNNFDVFNALTLLDNPLFLEEQKFGAGDGQLHYYLYNYRAAPIVGGVNPKNQVDERFMSGIGVVML